MPSRSPRRPGVIFTSFGDMMRVPGRQREPARGEGAGRRRALRVLAARRAAAGDREPRPRGGLLRRRLRDDRPVDGAHVAAGARARRDQLPRVLQPRDDRAADAGDPRVARPPARRVPRARPRVDGRRQPAVPVRRREVRQAARHGRVRAARHPAGRSPCSSTQIREGRCEVENQYTRVVRDEGNPRALAVLAEVFELRPHFEWRGLGFISQSALQAAPGVRRVRRRAATTPCPTCASPIPRRASAARCSRA